MNNYTRQKNAAFLDNRLEEGLTKTLGKITYFYKGEQKLLCTRKKSYFLLILYLDMLTSKDHVILVASCKTYPRSKNKSSYFIFALYSIHSRNVNFSKIRSDLKIEISLLLETPQCFSVLWMLVVYSSLSKRFVDR